MHLLILALVISALLVWRFNSLSGRKNPEKESMDMTEDEQGYYLSYYNHRPFTLAYFQFRGLQGGGPTWEALLQAAVETKNPSLLDQIELDAEGDGLFFSATDYHSAIAAKKLLENLIQSFLFREYCLLKALVGGYLE